MAGSVPSLDIDPAAVADDIASGIRSITQSLGRRGAVVGLSGGVDSAVTAALCVRALGKESVLAVLTPERESSPETLRLSKLAAENLDIDWVLEDITPILDASGCYSRRDAAISELLPAYGEGWKMKLVLPSVLENSRYRFFALVAESPAGERSELRLPAAAYREIVAAMSFKQRARKMVEYYYADLKSFAVVGTPSRPRVRSGLLRQERRRGRRYQAHCAPIQDAGISTSRLLRHPCRDSVSASDDRHVPARPIAGGILLLVALRPTRRLPRRIEERRIRSRRLRTRSG